MVDKDKIELSIIIPYYKTYELTKKLLIELIIQCNANVFYKTEIIIIDDGNNEEDRLDWYPKLLKDCFNIDNNVRIIHQENHGVSYARNVGIKESKGKYIAFIDSDDMVMCNYVETLLELIDTRDEDIILFNWLDINSNEIVRHPTNPAVWKAIYRREILPRFDETLKSREDYFFNQELEKYNYKKYYYDKVLYIYNSNRENSLTWKDKKGEL